MSLVLHVEFYDKENPKEHWPPRVYQARAELSTVIIQPTDHYHQDSHCK
jgi:hypothetical protein